jgi:hypothetical protein
MNDLKHIKHIKHLKHIKHIKHIKHHNTIFNQNLMFSIYEHLITVLTNGIIIHVLFLQN